MNAAKSTAKLGLLAALALGFTAAARPALPALTAEGWGGLIIGAEPAAVRNALGKTHLAFPDDDQEDCYEIYSDTYPGLVAMIETGRLSRLSVFGPSTIKTDRGLQLGAPESAVRRAHPQGLIVTTAEYAEEPAHSLTYWTKPQMRGVRYLTDEKRRVVAVHVGGQSIEYIEGCL